MRSHYPTLRKQVVETGEPVMLVVNSYLQPLATLLIFDWENQQNISLAARRLIKRALISTNRQIPFRVVRNHFKDAIELAHSFSDPYVLIMHNEKSKIAHPTALLFPIPEDLDSETNDVLGAAVQMTEDFIKTIGRTKEAS